MRSGTVTAAAQVLNISQPALSQLLMHTESELGFPLFERVKGRLRPTPEALELFPEAERIFADLEGLRRKTKDLKLGRTGLVRVASSTPPAMRIIPQAFVSFREKFSDVMLRTSVAPVASIVSMLREGDASVGLALEDHMPPDIQVEPLGRAGFGWLLPEDHELAAHETLDFHQVSQLPLITYRTTTRPFNELTKISEVRGFDLTPVIEVDVSISAVGLVQAGLGVGLVDDLLPWGKLSGVVFRPLTHSPRCPVSMLTAANRMLSRPEEAMCEHIRAAARAVLPCPREGQSLG